MTMDYPLLALPSHESYQLAHMATFLADALARHRRAKGRPERQAAVRDLAGGQAALDQALGATKATPAGELPRPIDTATYRAAQEMVDQGPRQAHVVSLAPTGRPGLAVVGHVPGVGPVGAVVPTESTAAALRQHLLTQPPAELAAWAVSDRPVPVPKLPRRVDLAAFVENLDPSLMRSRAVARHLRGLDRRTDAAIRGRFAGIDLDAPLVVTPPQEAAPGSLVGSAAAPASARSGVKAPWAKTGRAGTASRHICGLGPQTTAGSAAKVPTTSAGP